MIDTEVRDLARAAAARDRITLTRYYNQLVLADQVNKAGRPAWNAEIPAEVSGRHKANFKVTSAVYDKAAKAAGQLRISVAEYYRQLVRRNQASRHDRSARAVAASVDIGLQHSEAAA
ncbi:hypothetical protein ACFV1N_25110 [Streptosporangium canum]|uniref:hypothetical protein n=1 Tax=Streptosporangium canum TaxID=324952 RepID=UPI003678785B